MKLSKKIVQEIVYDYSADNGVIDLYEQKPLKYHVVRQEILNALDSYKK